MISSDDVRQLRAHVGQWINDVRPLYTRAEVDSLISDLEWAVEELARIREGRNRRLRERVGAVAE